MTIHDNSWQFIIIHIIYEYSWGFLKISDNSWLLIIIHDDSEELMTIHYHDNAWQFMMIVAFVCVDPSP